VAGENAVGANAARRDASAAVVGASRAWLLLVLVVVIWGANWPVMRVGVTLIPPLWLVLARLVLGLASLVVPLVLTGQLALPPRHDLPVVFSLGLLQMALFLILITVGVQYVAAGRSALLAYTHPLWVAPGSVLLLGERLGPAKLLGLALGLAGLLFLFNPVAFPWADPRAVLGNALLMAAALMWGLGLLHARRHRWVASPLALAPWQMLVAIPPVLASALLFESGPRVRWSPELIAILAYNGPIATAFCFWAAITVSRALPALTTSIGFLGVPMVGIALSTALLGEPFTWSLAGGLALILCGQGLVNLADLRRRRITLEQ
jgi:drug/metabolite transporter (DMT)-like permease